MKIKVAGVKVVDAKYLDVKCGDGLYPEDIDFMDREYDDIDEFFKEYPNLEKDGELYLHINVDTGVIENWPKNLPASFDDVKIVDGGTYDLVDDENHLIYEYQGYVPEILEIDSTGYGDYFEFHIDEVGHITDWHCDEGLIDDIFGDLDD